MPPRSRHVLALLGALLGGAVASRALAGGDRILDAPGAAPLADASADVSDASDAHPLVFACELDALDASVDARAPDAVALPLAPDAAAADASLSADAPLADPDAGVDTLAHAPPPRGRVYRDGPRCVALPQGEDLERARRLGLGPISAAYRLMSGRPDPAWVAAAPRDVARGRDARRLLWPVHDGRLGTRYRASRRRPHRALDINAPCGTVIRAAHAGIVAYSDNGVHGLGNAVFLVGANEVVTSYGHALRTLVGAGALVQRGQPIALIGETGRADACHVHYAARRRGRPVNPLPLSVGLSAASRWSVRHPIHRAHRRHHHERRRHPRRSR